ncbi:hypothetical protein ACJEIK_08165 [Mycobacterium sp. SMC-16]|uniref:hypothetical protein n=1 Tax=Mycobacterium sp. SMC-16 TaxID=3385967 RepID=UPI00390C9985
MTPESSSETTSASERSTASTMVAGTQSRTGWIAPLALLVAVGAAGLAGWALINPPAASVPASPASATSAAQPAPVPGRSGDKTQVCAAFHTVRNAVGLQSNANLGPDPVARTAVAANARMAALGGGTYLQAQLTAATPDDLSKVVRNFAIDLQDIGMKQLSGIPNNDAAMTALLNDAQDSSVRISELCK